MKTPELRLRGFSVRKTDASRVPYAARSIEAHRKRCSRRWYEKNNKRLRISAKRYILRYLSVAFFLFFRYYGLVTGNINHPVSPNVCGGIGNLTKGVNGLCCMALWN